MRCKPSTQYEYRRAVELFINPFFGKQRVRTVTSADAAELHGRYDLQMAAECALKAVLQLKTGDQPWSHRLNELVDSWTPHGVVFDETKLDDFPSPSETAEWRYGQGRPWRLKFQHSAYMMVLELVRASMAQIPPDMTPGSRLLLRYSPAQRHRHGGTMIEPTNARAFLLRCEGEMVGRLKTEIRTRRVTAERLFLYGAAKRTLAQAEAFRAMEDARNATVAASLVRLQLDSLLRLYTLWWVENADRFNRDVLDGAQIKKLKAADGAVMTDAWLYRRLASEIPWIETVYRESSGFVHFSGRHMLAVMQPCNDDKEESAGIVLNLDPSDRDRPPNYFNQLAASFTDVPLRIALALTERFDDLANDPKRGTAIVEIGS